MKLKTKKRVKKGLVAGLTVYVLLLFGMTAMLYMFGFESAWSTYTGQTVTQEGSGGSIGSSSAVDKDLNFVATIIEGIKGIFVTEEGEANWLGIVGSAVALLVGAGLAKLVGGQYAFAFIIPAVIVTIFANIFIFPISSATKDIPNIAGVPLELMLFAFFNVVLILGIIEFIRGQQV
jgi:hypothetical protein